MACGETRQNYSQMRYYFVGALTVGGCCCEIHTGRVPGLWSVAQRGEVTIDWLDICSEVP
jgi:hypothetical protein